MTMAFLARLSGPVTRAAATAARALPTLAPIASRASQGDGARDDDAKPQPAAAPRPASPNPGGARARKGLRRPDGSVALIRASQMSADQAISQLGGSPRGLTDDQVRAARQVHGPNAVAEAGATSLPRQIVAAFVNPFTLILMVLAGVSYYTDVLLAAPGQGNAATVVLIAVMVVLSGTLHTVQDVRSDRAAASLKRMVAGTATVLRDGAQRNLPFEELVPGDLVLLAAGDLVPADLRIVAARDLFVSQAALTGESEAVEKGADAEPAPDAPALERRNLAFMGTTVVSGAGRGVVAATGASTQLGRVSGALAKGGRDTAFDRGVRSVSRVLIALTAVMAPVVLVANGLIRGNWLDAALFAASVAVGLTPEMLPMIMTTCLAKGARSMARRRVVVRRMDAIQDLGAMDVLASDKTGTLTCDQVVLERHMDAFGRDDDRVLRHAYLVSANQEGLRNLLDRAIIDRFKELAEKSPALAADAARFSKVDELPFDFSRRRMSVVVRDASGKTQLITKGAVAETLDACSYVEHDGAVEPLRGSLRAQVLAQADRLGDAGMRVIAVAQKANPRPAGVLTCEDESDMVLIGYLAFLDPPKESAREALSLLAREGVAVKVLTGDNDRVAAAVCERVGIDAREVLLGSEVERMGAAELREAVEDCAVMARLSPAQKERVVAALRANGHVAGFMGDGINDAAAMRAADVGISVDTAVDVAREAADVILTQKDLKVLADGIRQGRATYVNMIKYVKTTVASNFGNVVSVLVASAALPFLPMSALQIVLLGMLYDLVCMALPWDRVDPELIARPRRWDAGSLTRFMVRLGPVSSVFDILTFAFLFFVACPAAVGAAPLDPGAFGALDAAGKAAFAAVFQAGWFVESLWSQSLVVHLLRTERLPFVQSRASLPVCALTAAGLAVATALPFTPLAPALDMAPLPPVFFAYLAVAVAGYLALGVAAARRYRRRFGALL